MHTGEFVEEPLAAKSTTRHGGDELSKENPLQAAACGIDCALADHTDWLEDREMNGWSRRRFLARTLHAGAGLWAAGWAGEVWAAERATGRQRRVLDVQKLRVVEVPADDGKPEMLWGDVAIVGGGMGGVAAAMAACHAGRNVCLFEETDWLGGQATSQGVTALDENHLIEVSGCTRGYQVFRDGIRDYYRRHTRLKPEAAADKRFSPGRGWTHLGFEPTVGVRVLDEMLAPYRLAGKLKIFMRCKAYTVGMNGDRVGYVDLVELDGGKRYRARAHMFIDATELGDLLALGAADFVVGAESKAETGEPHAAEKADAEDVQSFTYSFFVEHRPGERHAIDEPPDYARNRDEQPFTLAVNYGQGKVLTYGVFEERKGTPGSFWRYRRTIDASQFDDPKYPHDIAAINWGGNDYRDGNILVDDPAEQLVHLQAACNLSLGFLRWLQTEVPRDEGGQGYPELKLRKDLTDTANGLVKFPYIRESRRIRAVKTILEREVADAGRSNPRAEHFNDSVGIGFYGLDLHESKRKRQIRFDPTRPFQIPLGALIPRKTRNLLAGCKNIGTTHLTNGCYRLHPIEWAIGEAAGLTAALCIEQRTTPHEVRQQTKELRELQRRLVARGAPIMWYSDVGPTDERFAQVQMLPFEKPETLARLNANLRAP